MSRLKRIIYKTESKLDRVKIKIKEKLNLTNPVIIYPYRGFGNHNEVYLHGRILEREDIIHQPIDSDDSVWTNLKKVWKRYESDEVPGVEVEGDFYGSKAKAISDEEGYFTLIFTKLNLKNIEDTWHSVELKITNMPFDIEYVEEAKGEVLIGDQKSGYGVISDIDDTIIQSDILNPVKMISNVLLKDEKKRVIFPGVQELYLGLSKNFENPLLFVSGSSYNLYDMLTNFCSYNNIPKAPFIMRDLGIGITQWIKQESQEYKEESIERILSFFPKLNFILIGDSGEKDPEIYLNIHQKYPGRVLAIYIRHVHSEERKVDIDKRILNLDIPFLLLQDSQEAIDHARENNWMS